MNTQVPQSYEEALLRSSDKRARALEILNGNASPRFMQLASMACMAFSIFAVSSFEAPLAVNVLIAAAFTAAVVGTIELWSVRRRLEAAIELIKASERGVV